MVFAPYPDASVRADRALAAVERAWGSRDDIGAVLVEPVQGRGGVVVPPPGFLAGLSALCQRRSALLIVDEIMTGLGRTGTMFRSATEDVQPQLVCLGKALGGGLPISACIGRADVMAAWGEPTSEALHTGTFFGNPLACAAALAALEVIERDGLCARAAQTGSFLLALLQQRVGKRVRAVRGAGLLVGVELESGAQGLALVRSLLERGYITLPASASACVVSLTPPLNIERAVLERFVDVLDHALSELPQSRATSELSR